MVCAVKRFPCTRLIIYLFVCVLLETGLFFLIPLLLYLHGGLEGGLLIVFCLATLAAVILTYLPNRNAFYRVSADSAGISNRYLHVDWNSAADYKIIEYRLGLLPARIKADIICFGEVSDRSFFRLDPRKAVFIELNEKTTAWIRAAAAERSPA